jgi:type IV secretion system protein VirB9
MKRLALLALMASAIAPVQPVMASEDTGARPQAGVSGSYRLRGAPSIRPSLIWDDGAKTYLDWPEGVEAPAIFAIDGAGQETLVNSHYRNGKFVIDAVYTRLLFRLDRLMARAERNAAGS